MSNQNRLKAFFYRYCSLNHPKGILCLASPNFEFQSLGPAVSTKVKNAIEINKDNHFGPFVVTESFSLTRIYEHEYSRNQVRAIAIAILKEYRHTGELRDLNLFYKFTQANHVLLPLNLTKFLIKLNQ